MSAWPDKYVIGLTGNIATGKSVVRKMTEHLGAYGIDADTLSHRTIMKGAPGYQSIVDTFGKWILSSNGQIDREKLGNLVFPNPDAMASLEEIIHPLVRQAIDILVRHTTQQVIVIEAIKLLEGDLHTLCDAIWVTDATQETQIARLIQRRGMDEETARSRVFAQEAQESKLKAADIVIDNDDSFEQTWEEVLAVWQQSVPAKVEPTPVKHVEHVKIKELTVRRAGPGEAEEIAEFITRMSEGERRMTRTDVMASFGEKAFMLLKTGEDIAGLMGWQVENLVVRVDDVIIGDKAPIADAVRAMVEEVEAASKELLCEAALLFLPPDLARHTDVWQELEYDARTVKDLSVRAWQEAAMESMPPGTVLYFKQLRKDRVLRPV
ncbi:MAG: dephospho-CoA kinase [Chloroflexi bacterium]|nr:dephospho-CoA kinase [Chloroflexota bacterium]